MFKLGKASNQLQKLWVEICSKKLWKDPIK